MAGSSNRVRATTAGFKSPDHPGSMVRLNLGPVPVLQLGPVRLRKGRLQLGPNRMQRRRRHASRDPSRIHTRRRPRQGLLRRQPRRRIQPACHVSLAG